MPLWWIDIHFLKNLKELPTAKKLVIHDSSAFCNKHQIVTKILPSIK